MTRAEKVVYLIKKGKITIDNVTPKYREEVLEELAKQEKEKHSN